MLQELMEIVCARLYTQLMVRKRRFSKAAPIRSNHTMGLAPSLYFSFPHFSSEWESVEQHERGTRSALTERQVTGFHGLILMPLSLLTQLRERTSTAGCRT